MSDGRGGGSLKYRLKISRCLSFSVSPALNKVFTFSSPLQLAQNSGALV